MKKSDTEDMAALSRRKPVVQAKWPRLAFGVPHYFCELYGKNVLLVTKPTCGLRGKLGSVKISHCGAIREVNAQDRDSLAALEPLRLECRCPEPIGPPCALRPAARACEVGFPRCRRDAMHRTLLRAAALLAAVRVSGLALAKGSGGSRTTRLSPSRSRSTPHRLR